MRIFFLLTTAFFFGFISLHSETLGEKAQRIQSQIREIQSKCKSPKNREDFIRLRREFSPNQFIDVLSSVKVRDKYKLDFIQLSDMMGSYPLLVALDSTNQLFFKMIYELENKPSDDTIKMIEERIQAFQDENCDKSKEYPDMPQSVSSENCIGYMKYLDVEHSENGYLEFIILRIIGNQFLLKWHAGYNDREIIASKTEFYKRLKSDDRILKENTNQIDKIDFEPQIEISGDTIRVRLCVFTKWGGLIEVKYLLEKSSYIIIKEAKESPLFHYDCGFTF